ncbi:MAG: tetratricopeptide repeat protein [Myxococcales bacterium]
MQSAGPRVIRKSFGAVVQQPEPSSLEGQPLDEGSDDEPTSVLPTLASKSAHSPKTQPNLRNAQEVLDSAAKASSATPVGARKPEPTKASSATTPVDLPKPEPKAAKSEPKAAAKPAAPVKPEAKAAPAKPASKPEPVKPTPKPAPEPEPEGEDEEGAQDELDEAAFFMDQGMLEEAREILETVMLAYPGSARAKELMARLEELETGPKSSTDENETPPESDIPAIAETSTDGAFDLASELAKEDLGDLGGPIAPATDDFQVSVEDVFGEFKKGLKKVVKPEDVETHFDLGIAYKEMGLIDDAIGEFEQAASAAAGKKKELEALAMVGTCRLERDELADAAEAFQRALALPQVTPDTAKAVQFDLGLVFEKMGKLGEALAQLRKVQKTDPDFRQVGEALDRLVAAGAVEPAPAAAKPSRPANGSTAKPAAKPESATGPEKPDPKAGGTGKRTGKIGYV